MSERTLSLTTPCAESGRDGDLGRSGTPGEGNKWVRQAEGRASAAARGGGHLVPLALEYDLHVVPAAKGAGPLPVVRCRRRRPSGARLGHLVLSALTAVREEVCIPIPYPCP